MIGLNYLLIVSFFSRNTIIITIQLNILSNYIVYWQKVIEQSRGLVKTKIVKHAKEWKVRHRVVTCRG